MKCPFGPSILCHNSPLLIISLQLISIASFSAEEYYGNSNIDSEEIWEVISEDSDNNEWYEGHDQDLTRQGEQDELEEEFDSEPPLVKNSNRVKPSYPFSPNAMKKLALVEAEIYEEMKQYVGNMEMMMDAMRRYMKDYEESSLEGRAHLKNYKEREEAIVAHPLISHRIIRRFVFDLADITSSFEEDMDKEFLKVIDDLNEQLLFPDTTDYTQSLEALLRIQRYTNLDTKEFANGTLGNLQTNVQLPARHAFEIAQHALSTHKLALGIEWMELALSRLDQEKDVEDSLRMDIVEHLKKAVAQHDRSWDSWHLLNDLCFSEKLGSKYGSNVSKRMKMSDIMQKDSIKSRNVSEYGIYTKLNFMTLCSGVNIQTELEKSKLKCWYEVKKHPYLRINPVKIELLNEDPLLVQIYDLLDAKRIQWIIDIATPTLKRSEVINLDDPSASDVTNVRTSSQTWLEESNYPYFETVMRKIELITGLRVRDRLASETIQVANYGTSHHYDEHLDSLLDDRRTRLSGDRIGTFMFYLSDVQVGGKTAFPVLGTAANPVAGSAVFWYNLKRNGLPDLRTWHGGCPVVHGIKWVANKWILSNANWKERPCSLSETD